METVVEASARELTGSANARRLRREGKLPAIINSRDGETKHIEMDRHSFQMMLNHHASENLIVDLVINGAPAKKALLKDVQHHSLSGDLLHVDMVELSMTEKMTISIPVTLIGDAKGVEFGGTIDHVIREVEIECLPTDLVETFELDVSEMNIGDTLYVRDLNLDSKYDVKTSEDFAIAHLAAPRVEEEVAEEGEEDKAAEAAAGGEPEVIGKKDDDEEGGDGEAKADDG